MANQEMISGTHFEKSTSWSASLACEVVYAFLEASLDRNGQLCSSALVPVHRMKRDPWGRQRAGEGGTRQSERKDSAHFLGRGAGDSAHFLGVLVRSWSFELDKRKVLSAFVFMHFFK